MASFKSKVFVEDSINRKWFENIEILYILEEVNEGSN